MNTKKLLVVFIVLLGLVVIISLRDSKKGQRSFDSELTNLDTANVERVVVQPEANGSVIEFSKEGKIWKVKIEDAWYQADVNQVNAMMASLANLKAKRMAANSKDRWSEYKVTDSLATRVQFFGSKKALTDIYIGKFSFQQGPPSQNPYQQQQNIMTTYVRLADDKEVFAVDGFLSMSFKRAASDFRDKTIIEVDKNELTKLSFTKPAGSFNLIKEGNNWMVNGLVADSIATDEYLSAISKLSSSSYLLKEDLLADKEEYSLLIEGNGLAGPIRIKAFSADTSYAYAISSSLNTGSYFNGKQANLFNKIFIEKEKLFSPLAGEE